ncbi:MAG: DUF3048 domain-containing protein, partial [Actinomycetota bacterium]|nr:DUF3048 domain-containing protein [Actinomycetota bacterium]
MAPPVTQTTTTINDQVRQPENNKAGSTTTTSLTPPPSTTTPRSSKGETQRSGVVAPYRGTAIPQAALAAPRLALKIDNAPTATPQEGIQEADIVFEELVEGGLTRFLAIFHTKVPEAVGPIRSGRSTDIPLLMPF